MNDRVVIDEVMDDILEHYGTRGMKWGVRAKVAANTRPGKPQPVMIGERPGKPLVTAGGRGHPAVDEAKRAVGLKQKAAKSGVQSLTNKELEELTKRINLEQTYGRLTEADGKAKQSRGKKFVISTLEGAAGVGKKQVTKAANDVLAKKLGEVLGTTAKKAAKP